MSNCSSLFKTKQTTNFAVHTPISNRGANVAVWDYGIKGREESIKSMIPIIFLLAWHHLNIEELVFSAQNACARSNDVAIPSITCSTVTIVHRYCVNGD